MSNTAQNRAIFTPVEQWIRDDGELTDADLFGFIGDFAAKAPAFARAIAMSARDVINERGDEDLSYTDIFVEVYWRTFFCPEHGPLYLTGLSYDDPVALSERAMMIMDPANTPSHAAPSSIN